MSAVDPVRLVAEAEMWLHQWGIATVAGGADSATRAAADLLRALGVEPVDQHLPVRYRIRRVEVRREAMAGSAEEAEDMAHVLRMTSATDRPDEVLVEAVAW